MVGLKDFSLDASSNDVAAPPILWQEGQPAATVNNSARAMMAALACWYADNNGSLGASGAGSNALAISTNQGFAAADYLKPFDLSFSSDAANAGPCTLNPDGAGAKALKRQDGSDLSPTDIRVGVIYRVRWHPGIGFFTLVSPAIEPLGAIRAFAFAGALPAGWLLCDGAAISRISYAALFAAIGTVWGGGNGSTTFNVPDVRGRALFGADAGTGRLTGTGGVGGAVGSTGGAEAVALSADQLASHSHSGSTAGAGGHDHGGSVAAAGQHSHGAATTAAGSHTHGASTTTAGSHAHSGTTNSAGNHGHQILYNVGTAGTGAANRVVTDIHPNGGDNAGGASQPAGDHTHDFTTATAGDHSHGVTVAAVGDHAHGIAADGNHIHPISAVGDHVHGLSISATGSGAAHTNMPPGAVIVWAIKA